MACAVSTRCRWPCADRHRARVVDARPSTIWLSDELGAPAGDAPLRWFRLAAVRRARVRLRTGVVEAGLAARDRRHHLRARTCPARGGAFEPASCARPARPAPRALGRLSRVRRVRAIDDGESRAMGTPAAAARLRGAASRDLRRGPGGGPRARRDHGALRLVGARRTREVAARASGQPGDRPRAEPERASIRPFPPDASRLSGDLLRPLGVRRAADPPGVATARGRRRADGALGLVPRESHRRVLRTPDALPARALCGGAGRARADRARLRVAYRYPPVRAASGGALRSDDPGRERGGARGDRAGVRGTRT